MSEDNSTEYVLRSQLADAVQECERLRQDIRAAEQRGRDEVHAEMRAAWVRALQKVDAALARGGSTDEEQTHGR